MASETREADVAEFFGPRVTFTLHAMQALSERGISLAEVERALSRGEAHGGANEGREIIRDGDLRIVAERRGDHLTILTVVRAADFAEFV